MLFSKVAITFLGEYRRKGVGWRCSICNAIKITMLSRRNFSILASGFSCLISKPSKNVFSVVAQCQRDYALMLFSTTLPARGFLQYFVNMFFIVQFALVMVIFGT